MKRLALQAVSVPVLYAVLIVTAVLFAMLAPVPASAATSIVSVRSDGTPGNGNSSDAAISADGRYVAFVSTATNLADVDAAGHQQVYLHDRLTGTTALISAASDGTPGNGDSSAPALCADGRYIVYASQATNLAAGDTNAVADIFLFDRLLQFTTRLGTAMSGEQPNGPGRTPCISADGRYVAFASDATNLWPKDTNGVADIFRYDRFTRQLLAVDLRGEGGTIINGACFDPAISGDGTTVVFASEATNYVRGDGGPLVSIYLYDFQTGEKACLSQAADGTVADGSSGSPSISADGRRVAFQSSAHNLVADDAGVNDGVFVFDRVARQINRLDGPALPGNCRLPAISGNGLFVAFQFTPGGQMLASETTSADIYLCALETGEVRGITAAAQQAAMMGLEMPAVTTAPDVSADGRFVSFTVLTDGLVSGDSNACADVALHEGTAPPYQPDALLRAAGEGQYYGSNLYFLPEGQFRYQTVPADGRVTYDLRFENDGTATDQLLITGSAGAQGWTVSYYDALVGGEDITARVIAGTWDTGLLAPGEAREIRMEVAPGATVTPGVTLDLLVTAASLASPESSDTVRATVWVPTFTVALAASVPSSSVQPGTPITLTATASGGDDVRYQFMAKLGSAWTLIQGYSASNTCTWTPAQEGYYGLIVWAKEAGTGKLYETQDAIRLNILPPPTSAVTLAAAPSPVQFVNQTVVLTAQGIGGSPVEYQFYYRKGISGAWTLLRAYGTDNTVEWTPRDLGDYNVLVYARSVGSLKYAEARNTIRLTVVQPNVAAVVLTADPGTTQVVNRTVTLTATGSGNGQIEYRFYCRKGFTGPWTLLQDYSTDNTVTWTPTEAGRYGLLVYARAVGSTRYAEVKDAFVYTVTPQ